MKQTFWIALFFFITSSLHLHAVTPAAGNAGYVDNRYKYFFFEAIRRQSIGDYASAFDLLRHAIEINPLSSEPHYYMAMYLSQMNQDTLALKSLEKSVALSPDNEQYQERLAQFYIGTANYDKAIDAYTRLCDVHADRTDALKILLQLWQQKKDYGKMLEVIERIERADGEDEDITLSKVRVYELMNDSQSACNVLRQLADNHPYDLNYRIMLGNWLLQNNQGEEAHAIFSEALREEPNNVYAQSSIYDYYRQVGDTLAAAEMMEDILVSKSAPTDNKIQLLKQAIQENERQGGDSISMMKLFDRIIDASPDETELQEMKVAYMSMKKFDVAEIDSALVALLKKAPDNAGARYQLIQDMWREEKWDDILALSVPGMLYNPDEMAFYYFSGLVYYHNEEDDRALECFRKGVAEIDDNQEPGIVSEFYSIMGDILHRKGLYAEAYAAFDSCLQWKPDNIGCLNNYAYFLAIDGNDLKKAEEMSVRTIQAEPTSTTYLDTYAWILFLQQRYEEARIYIDRAMENDSTSDLHSDIYEHAGDIYALSGNVGKAVSLWEEALKRGADSKILMRKIKRRKYFAK